MGCSRPPTCRRSSRARCRARRRSIHSAPRESVREARSERCPRWPTRSWTHWAERTSTLRLQQRSYGARSAPSPLRERVPAASVKPAPFDYAAPRSLEAALALLGDESRPLAGGQSLVPMLNFRIAQPARLVDLNGIGELDYLRCADGALRIGALTRQAALERSELVELRWPLLVDAVRLVGHPAIRSRG